MPDYEKLYKELNKDVKRIIEQLDNAVKKSEKPIFDEFREVCAKNIQTFDYKSAFKPFKPEDK